VRRVNIAITLKLVKLVVLAKKNLAVGIRESRLIRRTRRMTMSVENGKVCCNCRHNIRTGEVPEIECHCDIDGSYIGYVRCMEGWCRHWSKENKE
jgi:hypothetical protein